MRKILVIYVFFHLPPVWFFWYCMPVAPVYRSSTSLNLFLHYYVCEGLKHLYRPYLFFSVLIYLTLTEPRFQFQCAWAVWFVHKWQIKMLSVESQIQHNSVLELWILTKAPKVFESAAEQLNNSFLPLQETTIHMFMMCFLNLNLWVSSWDAACSPAISSI